ncbi:MAG: DUF4175 family protein [Elusimicrobia bacterium]|nr:DUF4175 family protein [Elusimicrobiota bacterium]
MRLTHTLDKLIRDVRRRITVYHSVESFAFAVITGYSIVLFASFVDYFHPLVSSVRTGALSLVFVVFCLIGLRLAGKLRIKDIEIIKKIQDRHPSLKDNPINAWMLNRSVDRISSLGLSVELAKMFVDKTQLELDGISPEDVVPYSPFVKGYPPVIVLIMLTAAFYFKSPEILTENIPRFLSPGGAVELSRYFTVLPGNTGVLRGAEIEISVEMKTPETLHVPQVFVRTGENDWSELKPGAIFDTGNLQKKSDTLFVFESIRVVEDILYFVKWKYLRSERYLIKCLTVPRLGDFKLVYHFPVYTQLEPQQGSMFGERGVLPGTRIEFSATCPVPLKAGSILTSYGKATSLVIKKGGIVSGEIIAEKKGEVWFELVSRENDDIRDPSPPHYPLLMENDMPPEITLISPGQDIVVSADAKIPVVYRASDDYGISLVELVYDGKRIPVKRLTPPVRRITHTYTLDVSLLSPSPGDIVSYHLAALDNDAISGSKMARSETFRIEIFSYEEHHRKIEQELGDFRDGLIELLSDQMSVRRGLEEVMKDPSSITPDRVKPLIDSQKDAGKDAMDLSQKLSETVSRMETDPFINYQIYLEHKNMSSALASLSANQMQQAQESLSKGDWTSADNKMQDAVRALEKMNLLSEDVLQYQYMQDALSAGDKLSDISRQIQDSLKSPVDSQKLSELNKMLDKIDELTKQVNDLLKKFPQMLPEEFINQPAVKQIDPSKIGDLSGGIRDALAKGDFESALKQAQKMLEHMESMLKTMQEAGKSVGFSGVDSAMSAGMQKGLTELDDIVARQNRLMSETQGMENIRQQKVIKEQESLFEKLAKLQKAVIDKTGEMPSRAGVIRNMEFSSAYGREISRPLPRMNLVHKEFVSKKAIKSKEYLAEILLQIKSARALVERYANAVSTAQSSEWAGIGEDTAWLEKTEQDVLDVLNSTMAVKFSDSEQKKLSSLSDGQADIKNRTLSLDKLVQEFSRQTASISPDLSSNLRMAAEEMSGSEGNIVVGQTNRALENQRQAIDYLTKAKESMQSSAEGLSMMQQKFNKPMAGFIQGGGSHGGTGGVMGVRTGFVELPGEADYLPSRELKEEFMKSLKERYPETHETIIKQYYRKLVE